MARGYQMPMKTERQKMADGEWYTCLDDELETLRVAARVAVHAYSGAC